MSGSVNVYGLTSNTSEEYLKHKEVAEVCIRNGVSIPKETDDFFSSGMTDKLSDFTTETALEIISNGVRVNIPSKGDVMYDGGCSINVKDIPSHVDRIYIEYSY
jgi:hypothetical protein